MTSCRVSLDGQGGLFFKCPGCDGPHMISYGPGGWTWNGSVDKPTLSPSVLVRGFQISVEGEAMIDRGEPLPPGVDRYPGNDVVCHSYVTDGQIRFLEDCTHALVGKTVPLPEF